MSSPPPISTASQPTSLQKSLNGNLSISGGIVKSANQTLTDLKQLLNRVYPSTMQDAETDSRRSQILKKLTNFNGKTPFAASEQQELSFLKRTLLDKLVRKRTDSSSDSDSCSDDDMPMTGLLSTRVIKS